MESDLFQQVVFCTSDLPLVYSISAELQESAREGCPGGGATGRGSLCHMVWAWGCSLAVRPSTLFLAAYLMDWLLLSCFLEPWLWKGLFPQCH